MTPLTQEISESKLTPDYEVGYTTREHLLLDLDGVSLTKAIALVNLIMREFPKVGHAIIVRTAHGWHVVFDNRIGLNLACRIIEDLADLDCLNGGYKQIRRFYGDMTLRISHRVRPTEIERPPEIVHWVINRRCKHEDHLIGKYWNALMLGWELYWATLRSMSSLSQH